MKKIELQLTTRQLNSLVYLLNSLERIHPKTRDEKVMKAILLEISVKIEKKHVDVKSSLNTLFSKPKKPKFTWKYYEADALEKFLIVIQNEAMNEYDHTVVNFLKSKLNQQLA